MQSRLCILLFWHLSTKPNTCATQKQPRMTFPKSNQQGQSQHNCDSVVYLFFSSFCFIFFFWNKDYINSLFVEGSMWQHPVKEMMTMTLCPWFCSQLLKIRKLRVFRHSHQIAGPELEVPTFDINKIMDGLPPTSSTFQCLNQILLYCQLVIWDQNLCNTEHGTWQEITDWKMKWAI